MVGRWAQAAAGQPANGRGYGMHGRAQKEAEGTRLETDGDLGTSERMVRSGLGGAGSNSGQQSVSVMARGGTR